MKSYILDAAQKTKENTNEKVYHPDINKDEEINRMENANKDDPKVKDYGYNPEKHEQKKKQEKFEKMEKAREKLKRVNEYSDLNPQGDTRQNSDDLYVEVNRMNPS